MNHLKNTKTALRYWLTVPKENVAEELSFYKSDGGQPHGCGTIACFGGWVPAMPEFAAMGVTFRQGFPEYKGHSGCGVAMLLFRNGDLFAPASGLESAVCKDDHEIVAERLEAHIKFLEGITTCK